MYELIRAGPFFVGVFVGGQYPKSIPAQQNPPEKKRVRRFTEKKKQASAFCYPGIVFDVIAHQ